MKNSLAVDPYILIRGLGCVNCREWYHLSPAVHVFYLESHIIGRLVCVGSSFTISFATSIRATLSRAIESLLSVTNNEAFGHG